MFAVIVSQPTLNVTLALYLCTGSFKIRFASYHFTLLLFIPLHKSALEPLKFKLAFLRSPP